VCGSAAEGPLGSVLALFRPAPAGATHGSQGLIIHSARLVLIDGDGRIRAYHLATDEESMDRLGRNLRRLLAERTR
jgi:cytochrome oxidase Cu insertion factor (SCO1/SenC/PrrC family)